MAFGFYSAISINAAQVPSTQTDFPVLVSVTDTRFKTVGNSGHVQNSNGYDIRPYTDSTLTTAITGYELERYNASTGEVIMWVKVSSLSSSTTPFVLAYGDSGISTDGSSTATWSNGFVSVYHLKDGTTLSVADSLGANNGTNHSATAATGQIDGAGGFVSASTQYIDLGTGVVPGGSYSTFTFSAWVKGTSFPSAYNSVIVFGDASHNAFIFVKSNGKAAWGYITSGPSQVFVDGGSNTLSTGTWYYLTMVGSSGGLIGYVNAASDATTGSASGVLGATASTRIGSDPVNASREWNGSLDEERVASVARSQDWITTEYNNQSSPSTFETLGTEVSVNPIMGLFTFSPFSPLDIAGCQLWLKADSLVLNDGDPISTWTDSSGHGNDFTGVTTTRPLYKTGIINSKPTALFDGVDDFLSRNNGFLSTPDTLFLVIQPTLNTASQKSYAAIFASGASANLFVVARLSTDFWGTFTSADLSSTNALVSGTPYLLENTSVANSVFLYQRGVQVASQAATETNTGAATTGIGKDTQNANRQYAGHIAEVIAYDTVLSSGNRVLVENYLIAKYAL